MPTPRVPMSKIRRVLQLLHEAKLSQREVARVTGLSKSGVGEIASYARAAGLAWEQARQLDDQALQARMHPPPAGGEQGLQSSAPGSGRSPLSYAEPIHRVLWPRPH